MKTLQHNFTTPEQSKRLLNLGVPADSADMLWDGCIDAKDGWMFEDFPIYKEEPFSYYQLLYRQEDVAHILPCWSVGRLMEIIRICNLTAEKPWVYIEQDNIHAMITAIIDGVNNHMLDFSKLEDENDTAKEL